MFFRKLIAAGIAPVCGARLPGAPATTDSACAQRGVMNAVNRHVDHIVPPDGPSDPRFWKDSNYQVLCASCHSRKTATRDGGLGNAVERRA